ncbi:MAG: HD domain-containing phosphohydrolase [Deltaproteobacteria bacterium]
MRNATQQEAHRMAMLLSSSVKSIGFYPPAHQAVKQPLEELAALFEELLLEKNEIYFGIVEDVFFLEDHIFVAPGTGVSELAKRLIQKGIDAVTVVRGVSFDELFHLVSLLARKETNAANLPEKFKSLGIVNIRLGIEQKVSEGDPDLPSLQAYNDALHAVSGVMREIENGRIPGSEKINAVVDDMVSLAIKDHTTLIGLSLIKDYDNYTFNHSVNVGILALSLGVHLGMDPETLRVINTAGLLHDIGKIQIDISLLNKPGKLSALEYEVMKKHSEAGAEMVSKMEGVSRQVIDAVLGHHIKFNRQGYPEWARDRIFGIISDIIAVADCYDAMTTLRSYNVPMSPKVAIDSILRLCGTTLEAGLGQKFVEMMGRYPVGTLVRLDTNEIAVVLKPNCADLEAPVVKVVIDPQGNSLSVPRKENLLRSDGTRYASIVATVDPLLKNIDITACVTR